MLHLAMMRGSRRWRHSKIYERFKASTELQLHERRIESVLRHQPAAPRESIGVAHTGDLDASLEAEAGLDAGPQALELVVSLLEEQGRSAEAAYRLLEETDELSKVDVAHRRWRAGDLLRELTQSKHWCSRPSPGRFARPGAYRRVCFFASSVDAPDLLIDALIVQAAGLDSDGAMAVRRSGIILRLRPLPSTTSRYASWSSAQKNVYTVGR